MTKIQDTTFPIRMAAFTLATGLLVAPFLINYCTNEQCQRRQEQREKDFKEYWVARADMQREAEEHTRSLQEMCGTTINPIYFRGH